MKKYLLFFLGMMIWSTACFARDFSLEFIEENYRETRAEFSNDPVIYHSIQVSSDQGSKVLILTGDNHTYRKWLRYYISENKGLMIKIPDERIEDFIFSKTYEIDVTGVHPFNKDKWKNDDMGASGQNSLNGDNHVLIIDSDDKRTRLVKTVLEKMQYRAVIFNDSTAALDFFTFQPEKFQMVILHHDRIKGPSDPFVDQVVKLNPSIPVIIDTGYDNKADIREHSNFSGYGSVHLKPVILQDLQKTIDTLMKKNV